MLKYQELHRLLSTQFSQVLVDKVLSFEPNKYIYAIKNVSVSDPAFSSRGVPGPTPVCLTIEAVYQLAWLFCELSKIAGRMTDFVIERAGLIVEPGDTLCLELEISRETSEGIELQGTVTVDGRQACSAIIRFDMRTGFND
ncbi:MAG: hypothetical protein K6T83_08525 [Alicyclobacillus sp.]|nr:hypothetical protein [Alicyclobacillus sp.]